MTDLYSHFSQALSRYLDASKQSQPRVVLALSGGVDSRVLLHLLHQYRATQRSELDVCAVHVHHGLSPNADHWAERCEQWAASAQMECHVEKVTLDCGSESLEAKARQARYQALEHYLSQGDVLLTGHHSDDQVETFLLALKRGSGPKGLSAMGKQKPLREGTLLRPLLDVSREAIVAFAREHQLDWIEDESNQDARFDRNFIRHHVSPVLTERWPHLPTAIARSAQLCAEQELLLDELLEDKFAAVLLADASLSIEALSTCSEAMRARLMRMWFAEHQLAMPSVNQLALIWQQVALARCDANPRFVVDGQQEVRRYQQRLYLVDDQASLEDWQHEIAIDQSIELPANLGHLALRTSSQGSLSLAALGAQPLRITFDPQGFTAHPSERGHRRSMKKLFQEYGVPSWLRRRTPILMCGDQVAAVAHLFVDKAFIGQDCELTWNK